MPVQKFRSIEDMNGARVLTAPGEAGFNRFLRHCARIWRLAPRAYPRGVFRFRSVEEAEAFRPRLDRAGAQPDAAGPSAPRP